MTGGSRLDRVDCDLLTPFVKKALDNPNVRITEWSYQVIKGDGTWLKRLVCRFSGQARLREKEIPWSIFLKIPNPTHTHLDVWHREPFQREPLLYQSGVPDNLPGGMSAPCCLGVVEHPDDEPWMWLEDVAGEPSLEWPVERFRTAAYHFGMLQGTFLTGEPLPDYPWMDTSGWLKVRLARGADRIPSILERFQIHPLTKKLYNSDIGKRLRWLWSNREVFFDALESMPKTLCHGDFNYTNLFARHLPHGEDQTAAIDWQYAGFRQLGGDIAGLIADSSIIPVRRKAAEPEEFTELILEGYLLGLKESGWKGDLRVVRFACLARLAFPWSFNLLRSLDGWIFDQPLREGNRSEMEMKLAGYVHRQSFLLKLSEEARALLEVVKY